MKREKEKRERIKERGKEKKGNNGRLTPAKKKYTKKRKKRKEITKQQRKTSTYNLRLFT